MTNFAQFFILPFYDFHLDKDVGLFPIYLQQYFDETTIFKVGQNEQKSTEKRGIKIRDFCTNKAIYDNKNVAMSVKYQLSCVKPAIKTIKTENITHVMLFHLSYFTMALVLYLKTFLPKVKIYLKLDMACSDASKTINGLQNNFIKRIIYRNVIKNVNLLSAEVTDVVNSLKSNKIFSKLELVPNGFDDLKLQKPNDKLTKERTIITVGRLGTYQKNTELLLDILTKIDLKDWKVKLIGQIETEEQNFQKKIDNFYEEHPELKEKISFTGAIYNKEELSRLYESSQTLLFTSRFEGFALVFLEAAFYGLYIMTTDVGAAKDITQNGQLGFIADKSKEQEQDFEVITEQFIEKLQNIIDGKFDAISAGVEQRKFVIENFSMSNIVSRDCFKEWSKL